METFVMLWKAIYMEFMFLSHVNKIILAFRFFLFIFILSASTLKYPKLILNLCHPHGYFGCPKQQEIKLSSLFVCVSFNKNVWERSKKFCFEWQKMIVDSWGFSAWNCGEAEENLFSIIKTWENLSRTIWSKPQ